MHRLLSCLALGGSALALSCSSPSASGRIDVSPSSLATAARGATVQFTATAYGSDGKLSSPQPTVTWSSGNTTVATITSTGLQTATATMLPGGGAGQGTCTRITAEANGSSGQTFLAVVGSTAQYPCPAQ